MPGAYLGQVAWKLAGDTNKCAALETHARIAIQWLFEQIQHASSSTTFGVRSNSWSRPTGEKISAFVTLDVRGIKRAWCEIYVPGVTEQPIVVEIEFLEDYVCGAVTAFGIRDNKILGVTLTDEGLVRTTQETAKYKLAVPLLPQFATLADSQAQTNGVQLSQYKRIKPGNYTGYMRQLVQLLLGIGIAQQTTFEEALVKANTIPSTPKPTVPPIDPPRTPGAILQVAYDYRAFKTHGLGWGIDGKCYIIQIAQSGVYAWPLSVLPESATAAGRTRYERLYPELFVPDLSEKCLFDLYGGFPTGEAFPIAADLTKYVNAGEILKILSAAEVGDFFYKTPYSNSMGWAFAERSPLAVNTCWSVDSTNIKKGYMYAIRWDIEEYIEPEWRQKTLNVLHAIPLTDELSRKKARRLSDEQADLVLDELSTRPADGGGEEWLKSFTDMYNAIKATPPVKATGEISKMSEGWLYHPAKFAATGRYCFGSTGHPQFKLPDEELGFNVSFDFGPAERGATPPRRCDTPIWACWINDQLFTINYFWEADVPREHPAEDTREPCQYTGSWYTTIPCYSSTQGNFYSNFFDYRREVITSPTTTRTTTGEWAGTEDSFSFNGYYEMCCTIVRTVYVNYSVNKKSTSSAFWAAGAAVPFGDRSIVYFGALAGTNGATEHNFFSPPTSVGTTGYYRYGQIYHFVCHWRSSNCPRDKTPMHTDNPCVMWELVPMDVVESCLSDFGAPEFPHYQPCDTNPSGYNVEMNDCIFGLTYNSTVQPCENESTETPATNSLEWEVRMFGDTELHGRIVNAGAVHSSERLVDIYDTEITPWWFITSPACDGELFCSFSVAVNKWGNKITNYDNDLDPTETLHSGIPEAMHVGSHAVFSGYVSDEVFDYG